MLSVLRVLPKVAIGAVVLAAITLVQPVAANAAAGGTISGHAHNTVATLYSADTSEALETAGNWDGSFQFTDLPPGNYKVGFEPGVDAALYGIPRIREFWHDKATLADAEIITITGSETIAGIDPVFAEEPPSISGTFVSHGAPVGSTGVVREAYAYDMNGLEVPLTAARVGFADGKYQIWGLPTGDYYVKIRFSGTAVTFAGDVPLMAQAQVLHVEQGTTTVGPTITAPKEAFVSGLITDAATNAFLEHDQFDAEFFMYNPQTDEFEALATYDEGSTGQIVVGGLWPGRYLVRFSDSAGSGYGPEWWDNARLRADSEEIVLTLAEDRKGIDVSLDPYTFYVDRISGPDRFATNVEMSKTVFPESDEPLSIPVLYIANGYNFPDALSAGPAAAHLGGELLLVAPTGIPPVVLAEIDRLNPKRIVVVGGPTNVSEAVLQQLAGFSDDVERISGVDRYATSRAVVRDAFNCDTDCPDSAFFATGTNYPDALAAGPAAALDDTPVILVHGPSNSLDADTMALVDELGLSSGYIAGSAASVSTGIEGSLESLLPGDVVRFEGVDRYQTAVLMNEAIFGRTEAVFLTTGAGFADALSGGPLAAAYGAPLYLSLPHCIPSDAIGSMIKRQADYVVLFGSAATLSVAVENLTIC